MERKVVGLFLTISLLTALLAGCIASPSTGGELREIRMWVQEMDWEVHPNVATPVWAFCAEGDGVEPVGDGPCGVPGPTIRVTKGDTVRLTFENTHSIPHTVHFHGWHPFEADANGASLIHPHMVVGPGQTHVYEWVAEPAGTFIYHCHFDTPTHMDMGMYGAFIVEDPADKTPVDHEFVAVLGEFAIHPNATFSGGMPDYNFFTINGKSFPYTAPWLVDTGDTVRIHMVNAGFNFRSMHLHGHTPLSWEGVAGPKHAVPTDVRMVAPGQSVVLQFDADREGVWLFHDHVVPRVTAGQHGDVYGAYPRGMLAALVVGEAYHKAIVDVAPHLLAQAERDSLGLGGLHAHKGQHQATVPASATVVDMDGFEYAPKVLTVKAGTTVAWVNKDPIAHTITWDDYSVNSGDVPAGGVWSYTFDTPGTYTYHCIPHVYEENGQIKGMTGTLIVEEA